MWWKKKWIIIGVLAATLVLVAGIVGGVAYAQTAATQDASGSSKTLLARVATILGVDQTKVENAFTQAQKEMQDEALTDQLKNLVDQGKMTQQQADQYKQWWQSKPSVPAGIGLDGEGGFPGGFGGMRGQPGNPSPSSPTAATKSN